MNTPARLPSVMLFVVLASISPSTPTPISRNRPRKAVGSR